ncbi:MAG: alpha/beta fold hydrolase [Chitinophagales bacterium]
MKTFFISLFFIPIIATAQPKIKKVLVEGEGAPIVMLNGGTADMSVFEAHSKGLSRFYKVIRMEQFNIQYATENLVLPNDYSVKMESDAIKFTLDSLNIKEPIILVWHSYGGLIALDFALNHPENIRSLILIEPPVFGIAESKNESPEGMKQMQEISKQFTPGADITEDMVKQFRCELMNCDTFDIHQHPLWKTWINQKNRLRGLSVVSSYKMDFEKLHQFQKPVLIITGTTTVPFHKRIDELLTAEFSFAKTANIQGGHTAVNTNAKEFIESLLKFLK